MFTVIFVVIAVVLLADLMLTGGAAVKAIWEAIKNIVDKIKGE